MNHPGLRLTRGTAAIFGAGAIAALVLPPAPAFEAASVLGLLALAYLCAPGPWNTRLKGWK